MSVCRLWPGPECLTTSEDAPRAFAGVFSEIRIGGTHAECGPFSYPKAWLVQRGRVDVGIAMGRAKAAARMRRFVAWLHTRPAWVERAEIIAQASDYMSPEALVRDLPHRGMLLCTTWITIQVGGYWPDRLCAAKAMHGAIDAMASTIDQMLGLGAAVEHGPSPEWTSLPWQDPRLVARSQVGGGQ